MSIESKKSISRRQFIYDSILLGTAVLLLTGERKGEEMQVRLSHYEGSDEPHAQVYFHKEDWPRGQSGIISFGIDQDPQEIENGEPVWARYLELKFLPEDLETLSGSIVAQDKQVVARAPDYRDAEISKSDIAVIPVATLPAMIKLDVQYKGRNNSYLIEFKPKE